MLQVNNFGIALSALRQQGRHGRGVRKMRDNRMQQNEGTPNQKVELNESEGGAFAAEWKMERFKFLMCLNVVKRDKMYLGTVTRKRKMKTRSLNKRQKASRKANR
jgi:hypothetical protein